MDKIQKIKSNLWFDTQAEEAVKFYTSVFNNSKISRIGRYGQGSPRQGEIMTIEFQLEGQEFVALNGGPQYHFTEAISFIVHCDSQAEIDYYWEHLSEGGDEKAQVCGWLKDKYGVSWQIIPANLSDMITDVDSEKAERVMNAMLQMPKKLDMNKLTSVYESFE